MKKIVLIFLIILISFFCGYQYKKTQEKPIDNKSTSAPFFSVMRTAQNKWTNPLIDCEEYNTDSDVKTSSIKTKISQLISQYNHDLKEIAVYYRDLNNGPWFGINEKSQFAPVSLLKVPVMIAYLKRAETDTDLLNRKIVFNGKYSFDENIEEKDRLVLGKKYTVDELISRMITFSDNVAFGLLLDNIDSKYIKSIHEELDIPYPNESTPQDYITVKAYAGLFRILYNATYLSREMSEKGLEYLNKSSFDSGIKKGLPQNIFTALKFGYREKQDDDLVQFHDCGIVYFPKKPYLLCVMTKGVNTDKLTEVVEKISKTIYENLSQ